MDADLISICLAGQDVIAKQAAMISQLLRELALFRALTEEEARMLNPGEGGA